jgi:cyclopropane-fatty-acyl-phospholipid synthase
MHGISLSYDSEIGSPSLVETVSEWLESADVRLNGQRPFDMKLHGTGALSQALARGSLGLGEAYMDGLWDCDQLDEFFNRILSARIDERVKPVSMIVPALKAKLFNLQTLTRAFQVGQVHYDLGNDFYEAMLDRRMTYTCGYWRDATTLDAAQEAKLDLICRKLGLKPGMRMLDIGSGWGSLLGFAAEHYGVTGVGVTISREQAAYCNERYAHLPVEFRLQDYRDVTDTFDRIASVGMFEHVGHKNHRDYMRVAARCLKEDGLFLLHTIGKNRTETAPDPWNDRYIFPNGDLPSISQISEAAAPFFIVEDLHNFGADYDRTLMAWHANFEAAWPEFRDRYGERFYRMWRYYLLSCAGAFRARTLQLWQFVLSKEGVPGGYQRP